jgi:HisA/HisF family protein
VQDFSIIPVIDLKGGIVVHARGGQRAEYRPLASPFGPAENPIAIARALIVETLSPVLYIADLDAIEGTGNHFELCRALSDALPGAELWIDAGFAAVTDCAFWLPLGATLVVGSEKLTAPENWENLSATFGKTLVLSLDHGRAGRLGPAALHEDPSLWPDRVILIDLTRVGSGDGPDLERMTSVRDRGEGRAIYAGGGVRNLADLEALADAGASGALVATALHEKAIGQNEIAAFLRRRRSR